MIKQSELGIFIDLNCIPSNAEITLKHIFPASAPIEEGEEYKENKFTFEEIEANDSSSSLYYTQHSNKLLINVYGPRECRFRDKAKTDEAIVEINTKFNYEINKEKLKKINGILQNFTESLIFLDAYPRCQINICLNVLSYKDESLLMSTILNGLMFALSISGIDLKTFALTTSFNLRETDLLISLDANKPDKILLVESSIPLKLEVYRHYIQTAKEEVKELYNKFKKVLLKKLS